MVNQGEHCLGNVRLIRCGGTDLKELPPALVNTLVKRIEVHNSTVDENGVKHVPVEIHFTAVGIINLPDTEEILQILEEIRTKPLRIA